MTGGKEQPNNKRKANGIICNQLWSWASLSVQDKWRRR